MPAFSLGLEGLTLTPDSQRSDSGQGNPKPKMGEQYSIYRKGLASLTLRDCPETEALMGKGNETDATLMGGCIRYRPDVLVLLALS